MLILPNELVWELILAIPSKSLGFCPTSLVFDLFIYKQIEKRSKLPELRDLSPGEIGWKYPLEEKLQTKESLKSMTAKFKCQSSTLSIKFNRPNKHFRWHVCNLFMRMKQNWQYVGTVAEIPQNQSAEFIIAEDMMSGALIYQPNTAFNGPEHKFNFANKLRPKPNYVTFTTQIVFEIDIELKSELVEFTWPIDAVPAVRSVNRSIVVPAAERGSSSQQTDQRQQGSNAASSSRILKIEPKSCRAQHQDRTKKNYTPALESLQQEFEQATSVQHDGHTYEFDGFSLLLHRQLPDQFPQEPINQWTNDFRVRLVKENIPEVGE